MDSNRHADAAILDDPAGQRSALAWPAAVIGLGLVSLGVGLIDGAVFFHPIVLAVLPATVVRVFVVLAIGAGSDAAALGCLEML